MPDSMGRKLGRLLRPTPPPLQKMGIIQAGRQAGRQAYVISLTKEEGRECVMSGAERAKGFLKRARQIMRIYIPD